MTLSRTEVTPGLITELEAFGALLASLDDKAWVASTRCEGWSVADTSSHVVGSVADVVAGRLEGLGSPEVTAREVAERRGRSAADLAQELSEVTKLAGELAAAFDDAAWEMPAPGGYEGTLGQGVEAIWYDTYLHAEDVRAALGLPAERGPGLRAAMHHVASELEKIGWGPATLAFEGIEPVPVGGGGPEHRGDALQFVLVATGREKPSVLGPDAPDNIYA
jgi:uncharacterized protein (TIGR03083 family)